MENAMVNVRKGELQALNRCGLATLTLRAESISRSAITVPRPSKKGGSELAELTD